MKFNNTKERPIWWVGLEVALHQQILLVCNYTREKRPFFGKNMMVRVIWLTSEDSNSPCTCQENKTVFISIITIFRSFYCKNFPNPVWSSNQFASGGLLKETFQITYQLWSCRFFQFTHILPLSWTKTSKGKEVLWVTFFISSLYSHL